ncbi:MAG TPA: cation transporter [Candidatus Angelobacter sp.]|nr:cation transporter [Candidatus Angelobacter sp.]
MVSQVPITISPLLAIRRVLLITIAWMCVEVAVSAVSAVRAHSIALFAFGGDSAIELFSAFVVLLRFSGTALSEHRASRIAASLLAGLAAFIVTGAIASFVYPGLRPEASYVGIALLLAAALVMPWLAKQKRSLALQTGSSALKADATQSALCAYMAWIALAGLTCNAIFNISWADPIAALTLTPLVIYEAHKTWRGEGCGCH